MSNRVRNGLLAVAAAIAAALAVATIAGLAGGVSAADPSSSRSDGPSTTIAAIDLGTVVTTTPAPASQTVTTSSTPPTSATLPVTVEPVTYRRGVLPDGTPYLVDAEPLLVEDVESEDAVANEVRYATFLVTDGCGPDAVACSETNAVQVIPLQAVDSSAPTWDDNRTIWVESKAPRPTTDTAWIDPGPLAPRGDHDVHWTGTEMIVWGGALGDRQPHLIDGAAFDPLTGSWRMLSPAPFEMEITTRSVWTGDRMVVVSEHVTLAYDPVSDSWDEVGVGATPSRWVGMMRWTGAEVVMWNRFGVQMFHHADGEWRQLGAAPFGSDQSAWDGALRIVDGEPHVIGLAGVCGGRRIARWEGTELVELPPVSLHIEGYADCSFPNQTAVVGESLVVWDESMFPTKLLVDDRWVDIDPIPLTGTEGPQGPVALDERVLVPQWGSAAIYDPSEGTWSEVYDLPGSGLDTDMVWTGSEILTWGATCCYGGGGAGFTIDAWRWTPPG